MHSLALDGLTFGGEFLIGELLLEFLLPFDGFVGFAFEVGDLCGDIG
jgi:hypothetical protein